jgi:c(7)-type cytochrome triheme protein
VVRSAASVAGGLALLLLASCGPSVPGKDGPVERTAQPAATEKAPNPAVAETERRWLRLGEDGIRDPSAPGLTSLQQPAEALSELPPAHDGNQVDWVQALRKGLIAPRTSLLATTPVRVLDLDIYFSRTGNLPVVRFPHRQHTEWLDCSNCHDRIFKPKAGGNPISMLAILQGEFCGQCHGAVSFPLTQCSRCHSVDRAAFEQMSAPR